MVDQEYLERLREQAREIRKDLEERENDLSHENIMAVTRYDPPIVHKTIDNAQYPDYSDEPPPTEDPPLGFTDEQMDAMAQVIADTRMEFQGMIDQANAPLRERIAMLEGQVQTLLQVLGGDSNKSIPRLSLLK
jgi:hypothetical protein